MLIMRVIDVFYAFPSVLLAVAMAGVLGSGLLNSLISLTLVFIPAHRARCRERRDRRAQPGFRRGGAGDGPPGRSGLSWNTCWRM